MQPPHRGAEVSRERRNARVEDTTRARQRERERGRGDREREGESGGGLYCIVLYLQPVLNPKSYDGARVLEASGRPMLVIGRSCWIGPIQEEDDETGATTKLTEEITE